MQMAFKRTRRIKNPPQLEKLPQTAVRTRRIANRPQIVNRRYMQMRASGLETRRSLYTGISADEADCQSAAD
jgi:hypothetical protein